MSHYIATIARDGDAKRQIVVHWDDNNPNRHVCAPVTVGAGELDETKLSSVLGSMGFRVVDDAGADNVGRGWATVTRIRDDRPFFNPLDSSWHSYLSEEIKDKIRATYPGASVPGV